MYVPKRKQLLEQYRSRKPKRFIQYDGFYSRPECEDDVMRPEKDASQYFCGETWELMHGATVRVLIDSEATPEQVILLLGGVRKWINQKGLWHGKGFGGRLEQDGEQTDLPF